MSATIRAAGNLYAVLALRTFEEVGLAHALEIQRYGNKFKTPSRGPQ
jgi:hypothetical protein